MQPKVSLEEVGNTGDETTKYDMIIEVVRVYLIRLTLLDDDEIYMLLL
jgi:hypothetical protein